MRNFSVLLIILATLIASAQLPAGYWPLEKSQAIINKTQTTYLTPDLSSLSQDELQAIKKLNEVGKIFHDLYALQRHPQAASSLEQLQLLDKNSGSTAATQNLLTMYQLSQGPITTTLENKREAFLPVNKEVPGKNLYPEDVTKAELDSFLQKNPEMEASILHLRTVVRRATAENIKSDLDTLKKYLALELLHPGVKKMLQTMTADPESFYAVPYSIAYAAQLIRSSELLNEAADLLYNSDAQLSAYLKKRSRDLLTNDYESGDAAWVTGRFKKLNVLAGSYETYEDNLYGVKTFFAFTVFLSRPAETESLKTALAYMQELENSLPYQNHKSVKQDISVGVYDIVSDFAQSKGGNTATILPNESAFSKKYGRTILIRANILQSPEIYGSSNKNFKIAVAAEHANDMKTDGDFYRTLWHEIGHYLGVDRTKNNEELDAALQENADIFEEMKSDLVSLFVAEALHAKGYYTAEQLRSVYAAGIKRVLLNNQPRRDQPYNTMQLMQWNYFLENGLLEFNKTTGKLTIHYDKYHEVVEKLLGKILDIQYQGDKAASENFIVQHTKWDEALHGVIAKNIREQQVFRYRLYKFGALGE